MSSEQRIAILSLILLLGSLTLACGPTTGMLATRGGRWACPSPQPRPFGENGPVKREYACNCQPDPANPGQEICETCREYYEEWEQEYGELGGPPFPSPTPYGFTGTNFIFGQRVEIAPLHALVTARAGTQVTLPGGGTNQLQLYHIQIEWTNPTGADLPVQYDAQLKLRAITLPSGAVRTDSGWGISGLALEQVGMDELPTTIVPGESTIELPILAPPGQPKIVELAFPTDGHMQSTPVGATPTPNPDLRRPEAQWLILQWSNSSFDYYGAPACGDAGATTDWGSEDLPIGVAAPPGANRVVQVALNQAGKRYIWGAKGPETFDCSGLMTWSYAQIGITIPQGTAGQWPRMRPVDQSQIQPGDLVFFQIGGSRIDHVGMLVGDLDGDGAWDMVHASAPCCGVRIEYSLFESSYFRPKIAGFRTAR